MTTRTKRTRAAFDLLGALVLLPLAALAVILVVGFVVTRLTNVDPNTLLDAITDSNGNLSNSAAVAILVVSYVGIIVYIGVLQICDGQPPKPEQVREAKTRWKDIIDTARHSGDVPDRLLRQAEMHLDTLCEVSDGTGRVKRRDMSEAVRAAITPSTSDDARRSIDCYLKSPGSDWQSAWEGKVRHLADGHIRSARNSAYLLLSEDKYKTVGLKALDIADKAQEQVDEINDEVLNGTVSPAAGERKLLDVDEELSASADSFRAKHREELPEREVGPQASNKDWFIPRHVSDSTMHSVPHRGEDSMF